jgi:hypothetical protein
MNNKESIDNILKLLSEEAKRLKKKKKKSIVSTLIITRPMGSTFSMDVGVSMAESLNEGYGQKPVTKKFDHLKWPLNEFQKHFLEDFIAVPDESLQQEDYKYMSNRTGIPVESLKSIRNTLSPKKTDEEIFEEMRNIQKQLGLGGGMLDEKTLEDANSQFTDVRDIPTNKKGMQWPMNPNPTFRGKSLKELQWSDEMDKKGGQLVREHERELPGFMYEWLMYFIEGTEEFKITESKIMNDFHSTKFDKSKYVLFSLDMILKESNAHAYDNSSANYGLKELQVFRDKINEFNDTFKTNFIIANQYTGSDGFLKVVLENAQLTDGKRTYNRKFINMDDNDIKKALSLGFYDQFTTTRSITG